MDYRNVQEYETKYLGEIRQNIWKVSGKILEKYQTNYLRNMGQIIWEIWNKIFGKYQTKCTSQAVLVHFGASGQRPRDLPDAGKALFPTRGFHTHSKPKHCVTTVTSTQVGL